MHKALHAVNRFRDAFPWTEIVSARFALDQANEALAAVEARSVIKAVICPNGC
jgi:hypothetical protein